MKINIFGTEYEIKYQTNEENPRYKINGADGFCEPYIQEIQVLRDDYDKDTCFENIEEYRKQVLRHELFHAVFHETGLSRYQNDEVLCEFLAINFDKIKNIIEQAEQTYDKR